MTSKGTTRAPIPPGETAPRPASKLLPSVSLLEIERFALHDGPGIRTVVFLQGCPLHCPWCANPESQRQQPRLLHNRRKCTGCGRCTACCPSGNITLRDGHPVFRRAGCTGCRTCAAHCPEEAIRFAGTTVSTARIMETLLRDKDYYLSSGGGVTFSGGEAFMQFEGLTDLLRRCRAAGLHTAVETCGQVPGEKLKQAYPLTDLFLFDIKHTDREKLKKTTGADLETILSNLRYLAAQNPGHVTIRVPVIPGFNAEMKILEEIFTLAVENRIRRVHLLPYHTLGKDKYEQMGLPYLYPEHAMLTKETLLPFREAGEKRGLEIRIGG